MHEPDTALESRQARFQALLERNQKIVLKVAHTYCRHLEDRRDLIQEIAAQLWRAYPAYDENRNFSTWMYRIALNVAISYVRSASRRNRYVTSLEEVAVSEISDAASHEPDDRLHALYQVIEELDYLDRALILLYLEDRSYREIAEVLGISTTNVGTKLNRLKQRIRSRTSEDPIPTGE